MSTSRFRKYNRKVPPAKRTNTCTSAGVNRPHLNRCQYSHTRQRLRRRRQRRIQRSVPSRRTRTKNSRPCHQFGVLQAHNRCNHESYSAHRVRSMNRSTYNRGRHHQNTRQRKRRRYSRRNQCESRHVSRRRQHKSRRNITQRRNNRRYRPRCTKRNGNRRYGRGVHTQSNRRPTRRINTRTVNSRQVHNHK